MSLRGLGWLCFSGVGKGVFLFAGGQWAIKYPVLLFADGLD